MEGKKVLFTRVIKKEIDTSSTNRMHNIHDRSSNTLLRGITENLKIEIHVFFLDRKKSLQ